MKFIVIIQARMGSSRLPGKILKPLGEIDNLTYVTKRCKKIKGVSDVIVATSLLEKDDVVEQWCESNNIACYRGSEEDVLKRYVEAAKPYQPHYIIRVTADCPFVDYEMASEMVTLMQNEKVEIIDIEGSLPRGLAVEIISYESLKKIEKISSESRHREHVTYYAYEFENQFTRSEYVPSQEIQQEQFRITLDTEEDYHLLKEVAMHFEDVYVSSKEVVKYLKENPKIASINAHIQQKPVI